MWKWIKRQRHGDFGGHWLKNRRGHGNVGEGKGAHRCRHAHLNMGWQEIKAKVGNLAIRFLLGLCHCHLNFVYLLKLLDDGFKWLGLSLLMESLPLLDFLSFVKSMALFFLWLCYNHIFLYWQHYCINNPNPNIESINHIITLQYEKEIKAFQVLITKLYGLVVKSEKISELLRQINLIFQNLNQIYLSDQIFQIILSHWSPPKSEKNNVMFSHNQIVQIY